MRPKKQDPTTQELLEPLLVNIIDVQRPLVQLADKIDWEYFEKEFGEYSRSNWATCPVIESHQSGKIEPFFTKSLKKYNAH